MDLKRAEGNSEFKGAELGNICGGESRGWTEKEFIRRTTLSNQTPSA